MKLAFALVLSLTPALAGATELRPKLIDDESYAERFVAFADLEDGTYLQAQLGVSNVGPGDGKGACKLLMVDSAGKVTSVGEVYDRDEWSYLPGPPSELRMGPCFAKLSKDKLEVSVTVKGNHVDLVLHGDADKTKFAAHSAKYGDDFYDLEILIPNAKADARIKSGSGPERAVKGWGYADHPRSKIMPGKLAKAWVRFRALGENPRLILIRQPPQGTTPVGWIKFPNEGRTIQVTRLGVKEGPKKGKIPPWRIMIDGEGGPWRITSGKSLLRSAPVEEYGVLGAMVSSVVGNPVSYTYRAVLEGRKSGTKIPGLLEVTLTDE